MPREGSGGSGRPAASKNLRGQFELIGLGPDERPDLQVELVAPTGERERLDLDADGAFELSGDYIGKGYTLELGSPDSEEVRRFGLDSLAEQLSVDPVYRLPEAAWRGILGFFRCVTGSVRVCRPPWRPFPWELSFATKIVNVSELIKQAGSESLEIIGPHFPFRCDPVCRGKVEIFLRRCCCPPIRPWDPPLIIKDICEIIDCWPIELPKIPHIPPGDGPIGPRPGPGPDPSPELVAATERALKRSFSEEGAMGAEDILRLSGHLATLQGMELHEQIAYIEASPELLYWRCTCTTYKVAEVPLQEDGHFDACFLTGWLQPNCSYRVLYRVSQIQGSSWVTIYDGLAKNESFALGDIPTLGASWNAQGCEDPHEWGPVPFALLESIGNTWADTLIHSTQQSGETSFAGPLALKDGLANEKPPGASITAGPYDQPWGQTLSLRYQFHPGLQGLGAVYYRTRVVRVDSNGQPLTGSGAVDFVMPGAKAWLKYAPVPGGGGGVRVEWRELSDPAHPGLYRIPYPDLVWPWLAGQWHVDVPTAGGVAGIPNMPNGRYVFVLDLFAGDGTTRIIPNNAGAAAAAETAVGFEYRRLDGPLDAAFSNTSVVPLKAVASLFLVDNLGCYGDIEAILHNGAPSDLNCQFLEGPNTDTAQVRYSARHNNAYQWYHTITVKQGLTGPTTTLVTSTADVTSGNAPATPVSFSSLLGAETKCAFAAALAVRARHTNGFGTITDYDRYDTAAFALLIKP